MFTVKDGLCNQRVSVSVMGVMLAQPGMNHDLCVNIIMGHDTG